MSVPTQQELAPRQPSRTRWLWSWGVASVLAVVVAFLAGSAVRSPLDDAIANAARTPLVVDHVETLSVARPGATVTGTIRLGQTTNVAAPAAQDSARLVVTAAGVPAGERLSAGRSLVTVSGRPLIALPLPYPPYRSLTPGDAGDDVRAVQQVLVDLGLFSGHPDGEYGPRTARAVELLYRGAGSEPPSAAPEYVEAAREARSALDAALMAVKALTGAELADAQRSLTEARVAAETAGLRAMTPLPLEEIVTVPTQDVQVVSVAAVGTVLEAGTSVATLRTGSPSVVARAPVDVAESFVPGTAATVVAVTGDDRIDAVVASVGEFTTGDDESPPGKDITFTLLGEARSEDGSEVLVSLTGTETRTEGPAVPLLAVREDTSGTYVQRAPTSGDGPGERVPVEVLDVVDGYAFIESTELDEGDPVVVATQ